MGTSYDTIYDMAIFKFGDHKMIQEWEAVRKDALWHYMMSAIADFESTCVKDLSNRDDSQGKFNEDLSLKEIDIIATGIAAKWLQMKVNDSELLKNKVNTKEMQWFSPGILLREAKELLTIMNANFNSLMTEYSYEHSSGTPLGEWRPSETT